MATSWLGVGDRAHLYARRWWLLALFARLPRDSVRKLLSTGQPPHHKASHRYIDERFARRAQPLVVLGHPPVVGDPREGALHHPPTRQDPKTPQWHQPLAVHLLAFLGPLLCPDLGHLLAGSGFVGGLRTTSTLKPRTSSAHLLPSLGSRHRPTGAKGAKGDRALGPTAT